MSETTEQIIEVSKVIKADKSTVFRALTNEQVMEKWFCAGPDGWTSTVNAKVEVAGIFQIDMHGDTETHSHTGEYREVVENEKIVFTWNSKSVQDTLVTITLSEIEGGTEVKLVHDMVSSDQIVMNHTQGWTVILERLAVAV